MNLSVIYSKTAKGLRARTSLIGGLSSNLMKVLSYIDGQSKAETILLKFNLLTEQELTLILTQLENEGYIRLTATHTADDWAPTTNFAPMIVEEFQNEEEIEARARAKVEEEAQLEVEQKAKAEEEAEQIRAELKAQEKVRAEAKVQARLEIERVAREAEETRKKAEAEAHAKAEEARLEAERKAKAEEEARQKTELKAREEAEARAKIEAEENARLEIERVAREAEEARKKAEAEAHAKAEEARLEAECKAKAEEEARQKAELKAREETEARAKIEAEEAARLEAERKAKAEEEARQKAELKAREETARAKIEAEEVQKKAEAEARVQAEFKARQEVEQIRVKAEAKEKAQTEAKEVARLELERIVRKAEEDRRKSEAKAKAARQEAERKAKSEEVARLKAERKARETAELIRAKAEAEEKTRADAKEAARLEMERIAHEAEEARKKSIVEATIQSEEVQLETERKVKVEEEARLKAERKAREAAELIRAKAEAEEKANKESKENARLEMERIAREAEEARKKFEDEARDLSEEDMRELAEEDAQYEAERMDSVEAKEVVLETEEKARQDAEKLAREEVKRIAREEATAKARLKAEAKTQALISAGISGARKWIFVVIKSTLIGLPLLVLLLIGLLPFINLSILVEPIEKLASESVGEPVIVKEIHASLWPKPNLVIGDVAIGTNASHKIEAVHVVPETSTLFEEVKIVKSLVIEGLEIEQENFGQPLQWINSSGKAEHLKIEQINFKKIALKIRDLELGSFEGKVELAESHKLKNIDLSSIDHTLSVQIFPQGGSFDIALTATNWPLPLNPKIMFDELNARGTVNQNQINFSQVKGEIYGGSFTANAVVDWANQWNASGSFNLAKVNVPLMLKAFDSGISIDGKLNLTGIFACKSTVAANLAEASDITANFDISNGSLNGIELTRAVLFRDSQSLAGDSTHFDKLSGNVQIKSGYYQYRKLTLDTAQFHARGNLDVLPDQDISGKISADLAAQSRRLHASFSLTGKVSDVRRQ